MEILAKTLASNVGAAADQIVEDMKTALRTKSGKLPMRSALVASEEACCENIKFSIVFRAEILVEAA